MKLRVLENKKNRIILSILLSIATLSFSSQAHAGVWGESLAAAGLKQTLEVVFKNLEGMIRGALKQSAVTMINAQVGAMISKGGVQGSLFITNWDDHLFVSSSLEADVFMNDFFTLSVKGRASSGDYQACGTTSSAGEGGMKQNYSDELVDLAKKRIDLSMKIPEITLTSVTCNPHNLFSGGNWAAFSKFYESSANNPVGYAMLAQDARDAAYTQSKEKKTAEAIAYGGYKAQGEGGIVTTPGSTIKDVQSQSLDLGNKIIANAQDVPEIITATLTKITTSALNKGIGNAQSNLQRELTRKSKTSSQSSTTSPTGRFQVKY